MSNESTPTTLAGYMQTITLATASMLPQYSSLWNAPFFVEADNAKNVTFPVIDSGIRSATADASNDGASVTLTEITIAAQTAALNDYPVVALVSNAAIKGGAGVVEVVSKATATKVGNTIDKLIYSAGLGFSNSVSSDDGFGTGDLASAVGAIKAAGYAGEMVFIGDWRMLQGEYGLMQDIENVLTNANDEIIRGSGFLGKVQGVELYGTHMADTYADGSDTWGKGFLFAKEALGFGYGTPLVELDTSKALDKAGHYVGGSTFCAAKLLDSSGGVGIECKIA